MSFTFEKTDFQQSEKPPAGVRMQGLLESCDEASRQVLLEQLSNPRVGETVTLEEALLDFPGCAVVISHDRWFLDRIATHILAFEGDSQVVWFQGNYQDYEADRRRRLGSDADSPHRIRYKALA